MGALESVLMFLGSSVCHQLPERSYFLNDIQMPLCARCIGIHFGFFLSTAYLLLGPKRHASKLPGVLQLSVLGAVMTFFLLDAGLSYSGISQSDNLRRTLSGLALGIPLPFFLVPLLNAAAFPGKSAAGPLERAKDWIALPLLYIIGLGAILLAVSNGPLFYGVSVVGIAGVFTFFTIVLATVIGLLLEKSPLSIHKRVFFSALLAIAILFVLAAVHDILLSDI